jgi:hypothetical protein
MYYWYDTKIQSTPSLVAVLEVEVEVKDHVIGECVVGAL